MKQMVAPNAQVKKTITLGELSNGFFRKAGDEEGRIFFRCHSPGGLLFYPVLEDGKVSKTSGEIIASTKTIEVVSQKELGIERIYWA